jgi:subtilisin family serine protease
MRIISIFILISLFSIPSLAAKKPLKINTKTPYVNDEILVQFKTGMSDSVKAQVASSLSNRVVKDLKAGNWSQIKLNSGQSVDQMVINYKKNPNVQSVQPNYIYRIKAVPNDPSYGQLWALKNSGQSITNAIYTTNNPGVNTRDMSLEAAWNQITDCSSVIVAIMDTGIRYTHNDLAANMWTVAGFPNHGFNFVANNGDPMDDNGHGTHVAGTIGAVGNNAVGGTGVCWNVKLMAVKILDAEGSGTSANIINGLNFAVNNGARIVNMSFGGASGGQAERDAIMNANSRGVIIVVAAGNEGANNENAQTETYPCSYNTPNMICVAALDQAYTLAPFSNYGLTKVHVGAPGTNILSTWNGTAGVIRDDFNTAGAIDWTRVGNGWGYQSRNFSVNGVNTALDVLSNPPDWDGTTELYTNNTDTRAYRQFNLAGYNRLELSFLLFLDTEVDDDFLNINFNAAGGDPFVNGTEIASATGSTNGATESINLNISQCNTATCTVGFQLTTDNNQADFGAAVLLFQINTLITNNIGYNISNGTSMAAPHVAGLTAMVMAFNPSYTMSDVIQSVKNGGTAAASLSGKTSTGKAVNALGSLSYIATPTGVSAVMK